MKVSFDCATATILQVFTDGGPDDFTDCGPKGQKRPEFLQKSTWLKHNRSRCYNNNSVSCQSKNTWWVFLLPLEGNLEPDSFGRLAATACTDFRDEVVAERSEPGGQ